MAVTIFSNDQLAKLVKDTIPASLPPGHTNALVSTVDINGVSVVASFKKDSHMGTWEFSGAVQHTWAGDNKAGIRIVDSW